MNEYPAVAFLLQAHEKAEELVRVISHGGFEPVTWHIEPSRSGRWVQIHSKSRTLGEPPEAAMRDVDEPLALVTNGRNEHLHMVLHDPDAVMRRIRAERQVLAEHQPQRDAKWRGPDSWDPCELPGCPCIGVSEDSAEVGLLVGCGTCASGHQYDAVVEHYPCRTVLLLAEGWGWEATR